MFVGDVCDLVHSQLLLQSEFGLTLLVRVLVSLLQVARRCKAIPFPGW